VDLNINLHFNPEAERATAKKKASAANDRKIASLETVEEAFERILKMKNTDADNEKINEVYVALIKGEIKRDASALGKKLSKAEILRMHKEIAFSKRHEKIKEMIKNKPSNYILVNTEKELNLLKIKIEESEIIAIDCETFKEPLDPWNGEMAGFSVSTKNGTDYHHFYVPLQHEQKTKLTVDEIFHTIKIPLESKPNVMHNAPFDAKWFFVKYKINLVKNLHADTRVLGMALNENGDHGLKELCELYLRIPGDSFQKLFGKTPFNEVDLDTALIYAAGDTEKTLKLYEWMMNQLNRDNLKNVKRLVFELEMPVCRQFIKSDLLGIRFDVEAARGMDKKLEQEELLLEAEIKSMLGDINIGSPLQLKKALFEDLGLTNPDNGSTGVKILKKIKNEHPVIEKILEIREVSKLRQAFTQKLPKTVKQDGKVHPWHNTWGAATGRFTCKDPNTQQIPAKRPEIRQLFLSDENRILVGIDYSQIELRVLAHYAKDEILIDAFKTGKDLHSATAAQVFMSHMPFEEAYAQIEKMKDVDGTQEQKYRKASKTVNFGIVYGMSASGLGDQLGISKKEAQEVIDSYFKGYPGIAGFMETMKNFAKKNQYVQDLFYRKRRLHTELKSGQSGLIASALRMAGNFPIQSTACGILKKAIVDLKPVLQEVKGNIILQIHDELLFDLPANITKEELEKLKTTMENTVKLDVPIRCDVEMYPEKWQLKVNEDKWFQEEQQ
jgi:DNA polymerase-1